MNKKCGAATGPRSPLPTFEETHLNPGIVIDWNVVSAELRFVFGLGIVIGPLMFWKSGGYGITSTLMTFFSASSLSCILEKNIIKDEHSKERRHY